MKLEFPKDMHPEAIKFGEDMLKELDRQSVIQELDLNLLNLAVMSYHTFVVCRDEILKNGPTYKSGEFFKINPAASVMRDAQVQLLKIFDQLGMSPKSRKQLNQLPDVPGDTSSPLDAFLNRIEKRN